MSAFSSRLAIVLAFFSLILLVIVKEKFFKAVEHFMSGFDNSGHGAYSGGSHAMYLAPGFGGSYKSIGSGD